MSRPATSLLKRLACALTLLSASAQAVVVTATWNAASDTPVTASSYTATGNTVNFTLNFAPQTRMDLMVVKNTGLPFIQGTFSNLAQGQAVALSFGGTTYNYVANYYGGSGNDLVLQSVDVVLAAWGENYSGQLGNGNTTGYSSASVAVTRTGVLAGKTVISVAAGDLHNLALCSDGTIAAWGSNVSGQLGNGNTKENSVPVAVTRTGVLAGKTVTSVAGGGYHSLALCSDGTVAAWGDNYWGQLGNGNTTDSWVPVVSSRLATRAIGGVSHSISLGSFAPIVTTLVATQVGSGSATLNGTVNANGSSSAVSFDYGLTTSYGSTVAGTPSPVTGSTTTAVSAVLPGLTPGTIYHFRVNAVSSTGASVGSDLIFTTPSNNANLAGLALSTGTLTPAFASGTIGYAASVPDTTTSLTLTPTTADSGATVKVNGTTVASGSASGEIALGVGSNTLTTVVTASNGTTTKTYTVTVTRLPTPEIAVEQPAGTTLVTGAASIGYGTVVTGSSAVKVFTIKNTGTANLLLSGTPKVAVSGADASMFTVTVQPTSPVTSPAGTTTFSVRFAPSSGGDKTAMLTLVSNDLDEGTFTIGLTGSGQAPPEIAVEQPAGTNVIDGNNSVDFGIVSVGLSGTAKTYTIRNTGGGDLALTGLTKLNGNTGDFIVDTSGMDTTLTPGGSTTFTVNFSPSALGLRGTTLQIGSNDGDENPFDIALKGTGTAPDIAITGNKAAIAAGDSTPSAADHTDFGSALIAGGTVIRTFTVANTGTMALNLTGTPKVAITGSEAAEFTVSADAAAAVAVGGKTTFAVTFAPQALGLRTAMVTIANDDPDEAPYTFAISGVGKEPALSIAGVAGSYNGLVTASALLPAPDGTVASVSTEGFFTAAVQSTGAFTGKLTLDGQVLNVVGTFDSTGLARFGPTLATTMTVARTGKASLLVALKLDLTPPPQGTGKLTGTVTQRNRAVVTAVSTVEADLAHYNGTTVLVADDYLTVKGTIKTDGIYTAVIAHREPYDVNDSDHTQVEGFGFDDYPQGDGIGTAKISKAGIVTFAGTLADGTAFTASMPLSQQDRSGLFVPLYKMGGFISGWLQLDSESPESDFRIDGLSWCRPYQDVQHYPFGWPEIIKADVSGALYTVVAGTSALPNLEATVSPTIANALLLWGDPFTEVDITDPVTVGGIKLVNLSPADVVSKVPSTDSSFALSVTRASGLLSGSFLVADGTRPAFQGVIYQKGTLAGGHGFMLSTTPAIKDYTGQSQVMSLSLWADSGMPFEASLSIAASFTESYRETLETGRDEFGEPFANELFSGATSLTAVGTLPPGITLGAFAEATGVGIEFGGFKHSGTLGAAGSLSLAGRKAVFSLGMLDPNDIDGIRWISTGTITYTWTATTVTVTATGTLVDELGGLATVAASTHAEDTEPGPVAKTVDATISFGGATGTRTVQVTGTSSPTTRTFNEVDYGLASVSISGSTDNAKPLCAITAPASGARILETDEPIDATGTVSDGVELSGESVRVRLNEGEWGPAVVEFKQVGLDEFGEPVLSTKVATWSVPLPLVAGPNVLEVVATDGAGNESLVAKSSINYVVASPLEITPDGQGTLSTGFTGTTSRELGVTYTVTATPKTGFVFDHWVVGGGVTLPSMGVSDADLEKPTLKFIFVKDLVLSANFIANPFIAVAGSYNGLVKASETLPAPSGTVPSVSSEGVITVTLLPAGTFTGKLTLDGLVLPVAGAFDTAGAARFGANRAKSLIVPRTGKSSLVVALNLDLDPLSVGTGKLSGTVTQNLRSAITAVSAINADRAHFNGTTVVVPDDYLTVTGTARSDGLFTAFISPQASASQPEGLTTADYPQGEGIAMLKVSKAGLVTLAGTLADGTALTASVPLSKALTCPLFAPLYSNGGFIRGQLVLDHETSAADLSASDMLWSRPFLDNQHYPYGWSEGLKVDLLGARYRAITGQSVLPGLPASDADGNADLSFTDGLLTGPVTKQVSITTTDVVTKIPATDATFTLTINRLTGMLTGTFTATSGTKPSFQGIIYQKGDPDQPKGHGFFLTPMPAIKDYTGRSGRVSLQVQ